MSEPQTAYGLEDSPPVWESWLLATQHVSVLCLHLTLPLLVCRAAGVGVAETEATLCRCILVAGVVTLLQAHRGVRVGGGYLLPSNVASAVYFGASILSARIGGLPLVFGMTMLAGVLEMLFSTALPRLRSLITPAVSSLVVAMIGIEIAASGAAEILGASGHPPPGATPAGVCLALATLGLCILPAMLGRGLVRRYGTLAALLAGLGLGVLTHQLPPHAAATIGSVSWLRIPWPAFQLSFGFEVLPTFVVAAVVATLKAVGAVALSQEINDRPKALDEAARATVADGLGTALAGLVGALGVNPASVSVALARTSGASSRRLGYYIGALFIALACLPRVTAVFLVLPSSVVGALLLFLGSLQVIDGLKPMFREGWSEGCEWTLGLPFVFGLTREFFPHSYAAAPAWLRPWVDSSVAVTVLCMVALGLLARWRRVQ